MTAARHLAVFVHGILSSAQTWSYFDRLILADPDLEQLAIRYYEYAAPLIEPRPWRAIPDYDILADGLRTLLESEASKAESITLVSHSQGGLVVQRYLARMLADGKGRDLAKIRLIVLFACPNSGAQIGLLLRRSFYFFWRNPQERALRPLDAKIVDTQRTVMNQIVHAKEVSSSTCPIKIVAYAGASDGIVTPQSARSVFPDIGVLPGDHSTIIRPDTHEHPSYVALKNHLMHVLSTPAIVLPAHVSSQPRSEARMTPPQRLTLEQTAAVVDSLLAVPGMTDPAFRQLLYDNLPHDVVHQISRHQAAKVELFSLAQTFDDFPLLHPWEELYKFLRAVAPQSAAVQRFGGVLAEFGVIMSG